VSRGSRIQLWRATSGPKFWLRLTAVNCIVFQDIDFTRLKSFMREPPGSGTEASDDDHGHHPRRRRQQLRAGETLRPLLTHAMGSAVEVFDTSGPAEAGPPPHRHPWEEIYVVLSG